MERFSTFYGTFLKEAAPTKKNMEKFNEVYGLDLSNEELEKLFTRFTNVRGKLQNKDIFTYKDFDDLFSNLKPSPKEIKNVHNTKRVNNSGVPELVEAKMEKIYELLRWQYGMDLLDEDLEDIVQGYDEIRIANAVDKDIFSWNDITALKQGITAARNAGGNPIPEDPEEGESRKLYSDENLIVYKVENYEDSKRLCHDVGNSGSWCISYKANDRYWDEYTNDRNLDFIFILMRDGRKFAIATDKTGANIEIYDQADLLTSGYYLVKQHPEIVQPIRDAGYVDFKTHDQYNATQKDGYTEINEIYSGGLGSGSPIEVTSRIDAKGNYLDEDKDGTYAMVVRR